MATAALEPARTVSARAASPCARNAKAPPSAASQARQRSAAIPPALESRTAAIPGVEHAVATRTAATGGPAAVTAAAVRERTSSAVQMPTAAMVSSVAVASVAPTSAGWLVNHVRRALHPVAPGTAPAAKAFAAIRLVKPARSLLSRAIPAVAVGRSVVDGMGRPAASRILPTSSVAAAHAKTMINAAAVTVIRRGQPAVVPRAPHARTLAR